jgi:fibronectin type 3 domain-containing protein
MGYNTYSSAQSGGPYTKLTTAPVAATSYTDSSVQSGKTYYFVVTEVDSGNQESGYSSEVGASVP